MIRWAVVFAMLPSLAVLFLKRDQSTFGSFHDDGQYYTLAKSLAQTGEYKMESMPNAQAMTRSPPLWQWCLSLAWRIQPEFPANLRIASWMSILLLPIGLFFFAMVLRSMGLEEWTTALAIAVMGLAPTLAILAGSVMTEAAFCALLALTLYLAESAKNWRKALVAGLVAGLAFLDRSAALPLLGTVPLVFLVRKQRREGLGFVAGMLPAVVGWALWTRANRAYFGTDVNLLYYYDYGALFRQTVDASNAATILWTNGGRMVAAIGKLMVFNLGDTPVNNYLSQLLGLAALWGTVLLHKRLGISQWGLYCLGLFAMLCVWCYPPLERYLLPVFPLLLAGLFEFGALAWNAMRKGTREKKGAERGIAFAGLGLIAAVAVTWAAMTASGLFSAIPAYVQRYQDMQANKEAAYEWIRNQTPPGSLLLASSDPVAYLYTGRKALGLHLPARIYYRDDRKAAMDWFTSMPWPEGWQGPDYVLWTSDSFEMDLTAEESAQVLARWQRDGTIEEVFRRGDVAVYRVRRS